MGSRTRRVSGACAARRREVAAVRGLALRWPRVAATGLLRAAFKLALSHLWLSHGPGLQPEASMPRMLHWQLRQWAPNEGAPARGNRAARPECRHGDATHEAAALCRVRAATL